MIHGFEIQLNETGERFFSDLLGKKIKDKEVLRDGATLYFKKGAPSNKYLSVIMKSDDLEVTKTFFKTNKETSFNSVEGILIENPHSNSRMWDLIII